MYDWLTCLGFHGFECQMGIYVGYSFIMVIVIEITFQELRLVTWLSVLSFT